MNTRTNNFWGATYPELDRLFLGLWYVPLGILLHASAALSGNPQAYNLFTDSAYLPVYRILFGSFVPQNAPLFAAVIAVVELILGVLIFSRGQAVKLGLLFSAIFQILLVPLGDWGIINLLLAAMALMLLQYDFHRSIIDAMPDLVSRRMSIPFNLHR